MRSNSTARPTSSLAQSEVRYGNSSSAAKAVGANKNIARKNVIHFFILFPSFHNLTF